MAETTREPRVVICNVPDDWELGDALPAGAVATVTPGSLGIVTVGGVANPRLTLRRLPSASVVVQPRSVTVAWTEGDGPGPTFVLD